MSLMGPTADAYARGEAGVDNIDPALGRSSYQNVSRLGRWDLSRLNSPNVILGLIGLLILAYLLHRGTRRR